MVKPLALIGCIALLMASCKKDTVILSPVKNNTTTQTDSLAPFAGTFKGILYWSVAGGSSGSDTVSFTTTESPDKSLLYVNDGSTRYQFDAGAVIRHQDASNSAPSSTLNFSNDSLYMFVMQGPRFYHYNCKKQW